MPHIHMIVDLSVFLQLSLSIIKEHLRAKIGKSIVLRPILTNIVQESIKGVLN